MIQKSEVYLLRVRERTAAGGSGQTLEGLCCVCVWGGSCTNTASPPSVGGGGGVSRQDIWPHKPLLL